MLVKVLCWKLTIVLCHILNTSVFEQQMRYRDNNNSCWDVCGFHFNSLIRLS